MEGSAHDKQGLEGPGVRHWCAWGVSPDNVVVVHVLMVGCAISQMDDLWAVGDRRATETSWHLVNSY